MTLKQKETIRELRKKIIELKKKPKERRLSKVQIKEIKDSLKKIEMSKVDEIKKVLGLLDLKVKYEGILEEFNRLEKKEKDHYWRWQLLGSYIKKSKD